MALAPATSDPPSRARQVFPLFMVPGEPGVVEAGEGHGPRKEYFAAAGTCMVADAKEQGGERLSLECS